MIYRRVVGWAAMGLALVGAGVLGAIRDYRYGGDIVWAANYSNGLKQAAASHQFMLISFQSTDCDWCRKMDAETFTDPRVVKLSQDYVCVRVDAQREPEVFRQFHITEIPVTVVADYAGRVLKHIDGFAEPNQMLSALKSIKKPLAEH